MRKPLFYIAAITGLLSLTIVVAELALRVLVQVRYGKPEKSYGIYMIDKELGAIHRPNSFNNNSVMNNWGFRNIEDISEKKPAGALRVYCSGGSTTFCYNLPTEDAWPSLLQDKLRNAPGHEQDQVLNAAEIVIAVGHEFALARRFIPRLKPDIAVLYGTGINEQWGAVFVQSADRKDLDQLYACKQWGVISRNLDQARFLKRTSVLVKAFEYYLRPGISKALGLFVKKPAEKRGRPHVWTLENFRHTLAAYIDFLHANGCKVILVLHADSGDRSSTYLEDYILPFRKIAREVGTEKQVTIFDFASRVEALPDRASIFHTTVHLNKKGADLLAEELSKVILDLSRDSK